MESSISSPIEEYHAHTPLLPALSDTQDYVLSIVPIPAALLSIFGSVCIIRMNFSTKNARRRSKSKKRTPYNRLLIAMSVCDIIYSIMLATSVLFMPSDTSARRWAIGNATTCTVTGFFMQFSNATIIYNCMLSFYFLLIARFRMTNETISKCIEPFMHFLSLGYPLVTGLVGAILGVYSEPELSNACWVNNYPKNCGTVLLDGPGASGETCKSPSIGWAFAGVWYIVALFSLVGNNVVICFYVWNQTRPKRRTRTRQSRKTAMETEAAAEAELGLRRISSDENDDQSDSDEMESSSLHFAPKRGGSGSGNDDDDGDDENDSTNGSKVNPAISVPVAGASVAPLEIGERVSQRDTQLSRLKLVRSQALLFVGSYMLCMIWTVTLRLVEAYAASYEDKLAANNYTLLVLQAWFLPLQGFLNMFVYVRPKYVRRREQNPEEPMMESLMISVLGEKSLVEEGAMIDAAVATSRQQQKQQQQLAQKRLEDDEPQQEPPPQEGAQGRPSFSADTITTPIKLTKPKDKEHYFKRLKRSFISSITASQGDFVENIDEEQRWGAIPEDTLGAPRRCSSNKGHGSSSFEVESSGDITKRSNLSHRSSSNKGNNSGGNGSSLFDMSSAGDITNSNRIVHGSSSYIDVSSNSFSVPDSKSPLPTMDRMQSVSQLNGGHDSPLKFPHRQESKHQREVVFSPAAASKGNSKDDDNDNRWVSRESVASDEVLISPRRSSDRAFVTIEDLPAIDEIGEPRKSSESRASNDTSLAINSALAASSNNSASKNNQRNIQNPNRNRWRLPGPPLATDGGLDKPTRQLSDDDDGVLLEGEDEDTSDLMELIEASGEIVSSQRTEGAASISTNNATITATTAKKPASITMTGIVAALVNHSPSSKHDSQQQLQDPSESSELWSGELKQPLVVGTNTSTSATASGSTSAASRATTNTAASTRHPQFDRLILSEQTFASSRSVTSNRTSKSIDVALKVPMRISSEADEIDSAS